MSRPPIDVVFFHRKRLPLGHYSIESYFETVRAALPADIRSTVVEVARESTGVLPRIANMLEARRRRGAVNHITGDIHYAALALPRCRTVLSIMDCGFLERPAGVKREVLRWLWLKLPARNVALMTTISEFTRQQVIAHSGCPPELVEVVHVCVSPRFTAVPRAFDAADPEILLIGTSQNKNLERVAVALRGLPCRLHVVGRLTEPQRTALAGLRYRNSVGLTDDEMRAAYAECDLLLFASTYEGFGMPIVEANVVGRAVITSDRASMPEIAGDAACLVDPFDPASIRAGVQRVIDDEAYRARLVENGHRNQRRFSSEAIAGRYAEIYRRVAAA